MVNWTTEPRGVRWNLELKDENTLTLIGRVFRVGGAGGAAGGAAGAGDGRGGDRGFGRGPQQQIVLHRVK
jgi:hypothetical protein